MRTLTLRCAFGLALLAAVVPNGVCQVESVIAEALPVAELPFDVTATYGNNYILITASGGAALPSNASVRIVRGTKEFFRRLKGAAPCIVFYGYVRTPVATSISGKYSILESINENWLEWRSSGDSEEAMVPHYLMIFESAYSGALPAQVNNGRKIVSRDVEKYLSYAVEFTVELPGGGIRRALQPPVVSTVKGTSVRTPDDICYIVSARSGNEDLLARLRPISTGDVASNCPAVERDRAIFEHALSLLKTRYL